MKMNLEAPGGIEPPLRVLQTLALPLGYGATVKPEVLTEHGSPLQWLADAAWLFSIGAPIRLPHSVHEPS